MSVPRPQMIQSERRLGSSWCRVAHLQVCVGGAWAGRKGVAPPLRKKTFAWQQNRRKRDGRWP